MSEKILCLIFISYSLIGFIKSIPTKLNGNNNIFGKLALSNSNLDLSVDSIEERIKYEKFKENYLKVLQHNNEYVEKKKTFRTKLNEFSTLKHDEFIKFYTGKIPKERPNGMTQLNMTEPIQFDLFANRADSFDWRSYGVIGSVKFQSDCGSCWSFATTGAIEAIYAYNRGVNVSFSEQELIDCTRVGPFQNNGCDGGFPSNGFYHAYQVGLVDENSYPYISADDGYCYLDSNATRYKISGFSDVPYGDEESLKQALLAYGPVAVAIDASDWEFSHYSSGVYFSDTCNPNNLNHAVLVVGYGSEDDMDYWIVKNSWGTSWGLDGYVKMARNKNNNCGIASLASYAYL